MKLVELSPRHQPHYLSVVSACLRSEQCIPLRECPALRSKVGVSRSDGERASVLRLIGSKLCGGEIGQDLNVCCDNNAAPSAPLKQEGFEFKVRLDQCNGFYL